MDVNSHIELISIWSKADTEIHQELASHRGGLGLVALALSSSVYTKGFVEQLAPAPSDSQP